MTISDFFRNYVAWLTIPEITLIDILEIVIIAYAFYHIIIWIKDTRAWTLLKGMILLGLIFVVAVVLEMNVVLWVFKNAMVVGIMALVVIFQPELRNALEQLGRKNILGSLTSFDNQKAKNERYSERSIQAIIKAVGAGLGVSFLPEKLVSQAIAEGSVRTVPIENEPFARTHHIVYHRHKFLTQSAREFIALCHEMEASADVMEP